MPKDERLCEIVVGFDDCWGFPVSATMHVYVHTLRWHLLLFLGLKCGTVYRGTCVCAFLKRYMYVLCLQLFL